MSQAREPQLLLPIDEAEAIECLKDPAWCLQEKVDGERMTLTKRGPYVIAHNRQGRVMPYSNRLESAAHFIGCDFTVDGELYHGRLVAFDLLTFCDGDLRSAPYSDRFAVLKEMLSQAVADAFALVGHVTSARDKRAYYDHLIASTAEGAVFKRLDAIHTSGLSENQFKYKFVESASCIVTDGREGKRSIGLELIDSEGGRRHVGYCAVPGKRPLPVAGQIVEVEYLYATPLNGDKGGCLYQPAYKGLRTDVEAQACTVAQLKYKREGSGLVAVPALIGGAA